MPFSEDQKMILLRHKIKVLNANQAKIPKIGSDSKSRPSPEPASKDVFPKIRKINCSRLMLAHISANLFGAAPKIDLLLRLPGHRHCRGKRRHISKFEAPKRFGKTPPTNCPAVKNRSETIITIMKKTGKILLFSVCSTSEERETL